MRNRRIKVTENIKFNNFGVEKMQVRQPSLVDAFYIEKGVCSETGVESHSFCHPLYMLFNQERLNRLGDGAVQMWLKQLDAANNSAYSEIKKKLTDEQMLQLVKSRHIQHPSELEQWLNYLNERADLCNQEVAKVLAEEKARKEKEEAEKAATSVVEAPVSPQSQIN